MHGNVWERVRDCYEVNAYAGRGPHPTLDPMQESVGYGSRVLRGGSFRAVPWYLRSAIRLRFLPERRADDIGLRCVRGSVRQLDN